MDRKLKILYVHQYFKTPKESGSIRSYHLAKGLVEKGIEVELVTAHNSKEYVVKKVQGITVHYLPVYYSNKQPFLKRLFAFLSFIFRSIKLIHGIKDIDLCYTMTTPLSTGVIALYVKYFKKAPYIFEVGDLWPSAPIEMGIIKNPIFKKILFSFERFLYKEAHSIVALSPDIQKYISSKVENKDVHVITNISDTDYFKPVEKNCSNFRIGYYGTAGRANHLEYLLEVAKVAQEHSKAIEFEVMAEGSELKRIKILSEKMQLKNISFLSYGNKEDVKERLNNCQAIYISFNKAKVLSTGSPNKLFDGLAAGKLIIINFEGWIKEVIAKNSCGFSYKNDAPYEFIKKITPLVSNPELLLYYQKNARKLAENSYDKTIAINTLFSIVSRPI